MPDSKKNIEDSCSEIADAAGPTPIEPVIKELTAALHEKAHLRDRWMELCAQAAIEQDPRKLLKAGHGDQSSFRGAGKVTSGEREHE